MNKSLSRPLLAVCAVVALSACARHAGHDMGHASTTTVAVDAVCSASANPTVRCAKSPTAAFDARGRLWLVWDQAGHLYVNYSEDLGETFSRPVLVNAVAEPIEASGEARPKIVLDGKSGAVYVAWTKRLEKPHTGHIRFSRSLDGGQSFSEPVQINSDPEEIAHRFESMAVNAQGDIFMAWIDKRDKVATEKNQGDYVGAALYYRYSEDGGKSFRPERKIVDHICECCRISLKTGPDQLPVLMWRHIFEGQIRDHALTRFTAKDQPGPIVRVSDDHWKIEGCPHHGPAFSITPEGQYYATWFTNGDARKGLFVASSRDGGKNFSPPVGFGHAAQGGHADILAAGHTVVLVWKEFDATGKKTRLVEQHSSDEGKTWSASNTVAETEGDSDHPFLLSSQGQVYAAWQTKGQGFHLFNIRG